MPKPEVAEPSLSVAAFTQRCRTLAAGIAGAIELPKDAVAFASEVSNNAALMTLAGRATEMIARNRGRPHPVLPLASIGDDITIWAGYREAWTKRAAEQNLRFVEAGFTLHVGRQGELSKPQILRSEWVSRRSRAFIETAGHPHWQIDALESARVSGAVSSPIRFEDAAQPRAAVEFRAADATDEALMLLLGLTIERMHLASAALWWRPLDTQVAHSPATVADLDRWALGCVGYLRREAQRCSIF